jgi:hypothetical protein
LSFGYEQLPLSCVLIFGITTSVAVAYANLAPPPPPPPPSPHRSSTVASASASTRLGSSPPRSSTSTSPPRPLGPPRALSCRWAAAASQWRLARRRRLRGTSRYGGGIICLARGLLE